MKIKIKALVGSMIVGLLFFLLAPLWALVGAVGIPVYMAVVFYKHFEN